VTQIEIILSTVNALLEQESPPLSELRKELLEIEELIGSPDTTISSLANKKASRFYAAI
jgi:hypothetical protein